MTNYHLAQINIARMKTLLTDPAMAGFVARLDEINALADHSPGFVWRLQSSEGNATSIQPYADERILVNMSVWETLEALRQYVYRSRHAEVLRQRHAWFEKSAQAYTALWWVSAGHHPSLVEAKERLEHLERHGSTPYAFTFQKPFAAGAAKPEPEAGQP